MQYTNPWIEEGRELGRQEGRQEGLQYMILRLLRRRFGTIPERIEQRIGALSDSSIEQLVEALLDFQSPADAQNWFDHHSVAP